MESANNEQRIKSDKTTSQTGSVIDVPYTIKYKCTLLPMKNKVYNDYLPIIPAESRTSNKDVLFHMKFEASVTDKTTGKPVENIALEFKSNPENIERLYAEYPTNAAGKTTVIFETRKQGIYKIKDTNGNVEMDEKEIIIKEAWYESQFVLSHYVTYKESDEKFKGITTTKGKHWKTKEEISVPDGSAYKSDFLQQVTLQGTGITSSGKIIAYEKGTFSYRNNVVGNRGSVLKKDYSIAVDESVIPPSSNVEIYYSSKSSLGTRKAEDIGGKIKNYRIDLYIGSGDDEKLWEAAHPEGLIHGAYVKYLGK